MLYPNYYYELYYYYDQTGKIATAPSAMSVPAEIEIFAKLIDAITFVQHRGCCGMSQHIIEDGEKGEYHRLCLDVLKLAVQQQGEVFPVVLRGIRPSPYTDDDHKILFGTTDPQVAAFYGEIHQYHNVKGLKTFSSAKSVNYEENMDDTEMDEEIIFFPEGILSYA